MSGGRSAMGATGKAAAAACALALVLVPSPAPADDSLEYAIKANYLVKFAAFVQWPPSAFASPSAPVTVCVLGADPFGEILDRAAAAHSVQGRPVATRRLSRIDARSGCHIAYLAGSPQQSAAQALQALGDAPVLTVTDAARGRRRGVIHFAVVNQRVRFHIDDRTARSRRLSVSSRLLSLALSVRQGR